MALKENEYEVIIIGGGPAGLSAALMLGRSRRRTLVIDEGKPRNAKTHAVHGFLTRDCVPPAEILRLGREQLKPYGVRIIRARVATVKKLKDGFRVSTEAHASSGTKYTSRMLLLATGVRDKLPPIENIERFYGKSVHHCPYCDAWEWRDKPIAVYGKGKSGFALSLKMLAWTGDIVLCTNGPSRLSPAHQLELRELGVRVITQRIRTMEGSHSLMERLVFENGDKLERSAMFFTTGQEPNCGFAKDLGCELNSKGVVITRKGESTGVHNLFAAGDASHDMQFVVVAAAEGAKAGVTMHEALQAQERRRRNGL
jgi:thioredoxin reductase